MLFNLFTFDRRFSFSMPIIISMSLFFQKIMPARLNNELDPSENADTMGFNLLRQV